MKGSRKATIRFHPCGNCGAARAARPTETAIFLPDRLQARRDRLIKVQPPQGIVFASSGTETLLDREGVRAILDTPLKFNPSVAEAELSCVLLYELVHLNVALRASCAVSCPVVLRAC